MADCQWLRKELPFMANCQGQCTHNFLLGSMLSLLCFSHRPTVCFERGCMGRSKNPEQTPEMIIDNPPGFYRKELFAGKHTGPLDTLQLSKGGLYHYFKSKEEILKASMAKRARYISGMLSKHFLPAGLSPHVSFGG